MASILDSILGQLGGGNLANISKELGISESSAKSAIPAVVSLLTSALAKNASNKNEAESIKGALAKDHDGSILDNLSGHIKNYKGSSGKGILKHILGDRQDMVKKGLGKGTGMGSEKIGDILEMVAPVVMGNIGKAQHKKNLDASGVKKLLNKEKGKIQAQAPKSTGLLTNLLDSNQDGKVIDDLGKKGMNLLGEFL